MWCSLPLSRNTGVRWESRVLLEKVLRSGSPSLSSNKTERIQPCSCLVYTSNVFAILGLRSLYFVFANVIDKFHYLKLALAVILSYVGVKMVLADVYPIPTFLSLAIIVLVLAGAIVASLIRARYVKEKSVEPKEAASSIESVTHK